MNKKLSKEVESLINKMSKIDTDTVDEYIRISNVIASMLLNTDKDVYLHDVVTNIKEEVGSEYGSLIISMIASSSNDPALREPDSNMLLIHALVKYMHDTQESAYDFSEVVH